MNFELINCNLYKNEVYRVLLQFNGKITYFAYLCQGTKLSIKHFNQEGIRDLELKLPLRTMFQVNQKGVEETRIDKVFKTTPIHCGRSSSTKQLDFLLNSPKIYVRKKAVVTVDCPQVRLLNRTKFKKYIPTTNLCVAVCDSICDLFPAEVLSLHTCHYLPARGNNQKTSQSSTCFLGGDDKKPLCWTRPVVTVSFFRALHLAMSWWNCVLFAFPRGNLNKKRIVKFFVVKEWSSFLNL